MLYSLLKNCIIDNFLLQNLIERVRKTGLGKNLSARANWSFLRLTHSDVFVFHRDFFFLVTALRSERAYQGLSVSYVFCWKPQNSWGAILFTFVNAGVIDLKIANRKALALDTRAVAALELFADLLLVKFWGKWLLRNWWTWTWRQIYNPCFW